MNCSSKNIVNISRKKNVTDILTFSQHVFASNCEAFVEDDEF